MFDDNKISRYQYNQLLYDYNRLESLYKELKQTTDEDYEIFRKDGYIRTYAFEEQYQKCLYRRKYHELSLMNKQFKEKINNLEIENEQLKSNEIVVMNNKEKSTKEPLFKCCNLCYDKIEDDEVQYSFRCENKKCNKLFHTKCILKINEENRNQCCYCKVYYKNYNFVNIGFLQNQDYLVYDSNNFDYSQPYFYWISDFYKIDKEKIKKIIKLQSYYRGFIIRRAVEEKKYSDEIRKKYSYYIQNSISNYVNHSKMIFNEI